MPGLFTVQWVSLGSQLRALLKEAVNCPMLPLLPRALALPSASNALTCHADASVNAAAAGTTDVKGSAQDMTGYAGIRGIATNLAEKKGVGINSTEMNLTSDGKQALNITKLLSVNTPDDFVAGLAQVHYGQPELGIAGPHLYPFGGFDKLFDWLSGWAGGPQLYSQRPDRACIMSAHAPYAIGHAEVDQWLACMRQALDQVEPPPYWREILDQAFVRMCDGLRNS